MHVEERRITTIDLHDGKARCYLLHQEEHGYKLMIAARDETLHLYLPAHDLSQLRDALRSQPLPAVQRIGTRQHGDNATEWLAYN